MVSSSARYRPSATLIGSTSPMRSAIVMSGVASFSPYRRSRGIQTISTAPPFSAIRARQAPDRRERVVVDLAAGERGHRLVEQRREEARHARLGLAALAEEDDVLTREDRVLELGHDALVVPDDRGEERLPAPKARDHVVAQLLLDRLRLPAAGPELPDRACPHLASPFSPSTPHNHAERSSSSSPHTECGIGYSRHVTR